MQFLCVFMYFWLMSILGWGIEVLACSLEARKFVNRGFLIGPYCPIYGFGGLVLLCLARCHNNWILVFILSIILCSILEYVTSYLMEIAFKVRWWDYSSEPFNINGRICLRNAVGFGILGVLLVCVISPFIFKWFNSLPIMFTEISCLVIFMVTLCDIIISLVVMKDIKKTISSLNKVKSNLRDATNDIKDTIKDVLLNKNFLARRIVKAYNQFECYRDGIIDKLSEYRKKKVKNLKKTKRDKAEYLGILVAFGIVTGIIIGYITKHYKLSIIICLGISVLADLLYDKIRRDDEYEK